MKKEEAKKISAEYAEARDKLAMMLGQLHLLEEHLSYLSKKIDDNGDPAFDCQEAERYLGIALGSTTEYAKDYLDLAEGKTSEQ